MKRESGFAHGVAACEMLCSAHATRGTSARGGRSGTGVRLTSDRCRRRRRSRHRRRHRRRHRGSRAVRPMRLMSDSVLHFSDNRVAALPQVVRAETGLGWRSSPARWKMIAGRKHSRFRDPHAIRWIRACIDSADSCGRSITTASRNAGNCEPGSAHGVVARAGLAALRIARLAAALDEGLDRAGRDVEDHVGELPGCGDPEDVGV